MEGRFEIVVCCCCCCLFKSQVPSVLDSSCLSLAYLKDNNETSSCHSRLTGKVVFKLCSSEPQGSLEDPPWESPRGKAMVNLKRLLAISSSHIASLLSLCLPFNQNNSAFICFMYWPSHLVSFRKAALQLTILKSRLSEW